MMFVGEMGCRYAESGRHDICADGMERAIRKGQEQCRANWGSVHLPFACDDMGCNVPCLALEV